VDGEVVSPGRTLTVAVLPRALTVRVPAVKVPVRLRSGRARKAEAPNAGVPVTAETTGGVADLN
jgi:hypothetical protein